jgi:glucokinase
MKELAIGVDVGGTKIAAGVLDRQGRLLSQHVIRCYGGDSPEAVVEAVDGIVRIVRSDAGVMQQDIAGVGVGSAGNIDFQRAVLTTATRPVAKYLRKYYAGGWKRRSS